MAKKKTAREKLHAPTSPKVETLDAANAARLKVATLLIPTPLQIDAALKAIPSGQTRTDREVREDLARQSEADSTCALCTGIFWRVCAEAAEEDRADGATEITPWWRMTKAGKPNPKLPGGVENHRSLLAAEGVHI